MTSRHANISIFVPHYGCPNMCSFCNQKHITGKDKAPIAEDVINAVDTAVNTSNYNPSNTEIAFFGGSFTAIDRNYMIDLLKTANQFVENSTVAGVRISTRPDAIDNEVLLLLKKYGVTSIELGAQSMIDDVLAANNRGHSVADVINASHLIKKHGFSLGLQMMTGLYGDCNEYSINTANQIIDLHPDTVRIYPTIVLKNTDLEILYNIGKYIPQTLENAVDLSSQLLLMFEQANIKVIRLGLHSIEKDSYVAGPWHSAFSELCYSKLYFDRVQSLLKEKGNYTLYVNPSSVSKMIGQHKENINQLKKIGFDCVVKMDTSLSDRQIRVERR